MIDIKDVVAGTSYACKYRVTTMLDAQGKPAQLNLGETAKGPGVYEGLGVISQRDMESQLVKLVDVETQREFVVNFEDIWDIDTVEWQDD